MRFISMSTIKQTEANRENAQRSTGPRTPEGKSKSSKNALKHGLTAAQLVLPTESQDDFDEHAAQLRDEHDPSTPTEHLLVDQLITASWRLRRARIIETTYYQQRATEVARYPDDPPHVITTIFRLCDKQLDSLARQEARIERSFYRALHELQKLKKERQKESSEKVQNKPISQPNSMIPFTEAPPDPHPAPLSSPRIEPTQDPSSVIK